MDERIWRCVCGGPHFLSVSRFHDGDTVYLCVEEAVPDGHWARVVACWHLLTRRRHTWYELLLTPAQARDVARELTDPPTKR